MSRVRRYVHTYFGRKRDLPLSILVFTLAKKMYDFLYFKYRKYRTKISPVKISDKEFLEIFNCSSLSQIQAKINRTFFFSYEKKDEIVKTVQNLYPSSISETIRDADRICGHVFNFLGSGDVNLGARINWHQDFKSKKVWSLEYCKELKHVDLTDDSDVKVPWELSRFQHFATLGKAYWYTNDEKYAKEFVEQVDDWIDSNPVEYGVNWKSAMDVAIRAVNCIFAYNFFVHSKKFTEDFAVRFFKMLFLHGRFVLRNLEWGVVRGNHYLSNVVGLIYLGLFFDETREGEYWLRKGLESLVKEIEHQVYSDGVDHEASIGYHRLVTEMFLSSFLLCKINNIRLPNSFINKLEKMIEFTLFYTKPTGFAPVIGDADDGRLHILSKNAVNDHRYLLSIGAALFGRSDFKKYSNGFNEEALWLLGKEGLSRFERLKTAKERLRSRAFEEGGFYVMREDDLYMIIDCGGIGLKGFGGHGHCDTLSFELAVGNRAFIVDPGAYVYTASPKWRNLFRGTAYHNTVMVDGKEINRFNDYNLFSMENDDDPKVNKWLSTEECDFFDGHHHGYRRLKDPVIHRRQVLFNKEGRYWIVKDVLMAKEEHRYDLYFHFSPLKVFQCKSDPLTIETQNEDGWNVMVIPVEREKLSMAITSGWVSYSYGEKTEAPVVKYSKTVKGGTSFLTIIYPYIKNVRGVEEIVKDVQSYLSARKKKLFN